ncbi:MAG: MBL fold metallo-hydrolase [Muribaculaceae bacterium]|nr:MBL fold metallo-hydrolase [Muribaculaceae bacterium]
MKRINRYLLNAILILSIFMSGFSFETVTVSAADPDKMEVHFMDVGQGDATLIICGKHAMLIDTGDSSKGTAIQNYLQKQKIEKLDYLILTHPDSDHIGGAPVILTKFDVKKVFMSNYEKDNKDYQKLIQTLDDKRTEYKTPQVGFRYFLGTAVITFIAPNDIYDNPNDSSIACIIKNGDTKFLFTGDAGEDAEQDILDTELDISADVYHVGHHGSKYSTSEEFLEAVNPDYAVISCAEGNSYGHPHAETLNKLRMGGIKVYRTDEEGAIVAVSDGKKIEFNVPASETWKAGEPSGSAAKKTQLQTNQNKEAVQSVQPQKDQNQETAQPQKNQNQETLQPTEETVQPAGNTATTELTYVLNTKTKKFHRPSCSYLPTANRKDSSESRDSIVAQGYEPCKKCNP